MTMTTHGPGKYDDEATAARDSAQAEGVVLIVLRGHAGSGFSVQLPPPDLLRLPDVLEDIAQRIREELEGGRR